MIIVKFKTDHRDCICITVRSFVRYEIEMRVVTLVHSDAFAFAFASASVFTGSIILVLVLLYVFYLNVYKEGSRYNCIRKCRSLKVVSLTKCLF